jgi:propanol-preferring alcohol dehydrogenase
MPDGIPDDVAAPLLCAGAIGYRSFMLTGVRNGGVLGLTGFGASGHQVLKLARVLAPKSPIVVFARNPEERKLALQLGATWSGASDEHAPLPCDAIIDTTPAWTPIVHALRALAPGGRLVINAIRKEAKDQHALAALDYATDLWKEKEIKSVANIARQDVRDFLRIAAEHQLFPTTMVYPFTEACAALIDLKHGRGTGAKVLRMK